MGFPLPPELLPPILDYIFFPFDLDSLDSCCLVSKTWYHYARSYRFRIVYFRTSREDTKGKLQQLRSSPHLLPHITHVVLLQHSPSDEAWELDDARELAKLLCQTENICIRDWSGRGVNPEQWTVGIDCLSAFMDHLGSRSNGPNMISIRNVLCEAPEDLFQMLSKVPGSPRELRLDSVGHLNDQMQFTACEDYNSTLWMPVNPGWKLGALTLNTTELRQDIYSWLLNQAVDVSHLQKLTIVPFFPNDANNKSVAPELLQAIGSSLKEFNLVCQRDKPPVADLHGTLQQLPMLEKLVIGSDPSYEYMPMSLTITSGLSLCVETIRSLQRHESIQEIILAVDVILASTGDVESFTEDLVTSSSEWEVLDTLLADLSSFPRFRHFHLIVEIMRTVTEGPNKPWTTNTELCRNVQTRVRAALPQLSARGALAVYAEEMTSDLEHWLERIPDNRKFPYTSYSFDQQRQWHVSELI